MGVLLKTIFCRSLTLCISNKIQNLQNCWTTSNNQEGRRPKTDKHLPQSPFTGKFIQMTTFCFGVFIVNQVVNSATTSLVCIEAVEEVSAGDTSFPSFPEGELIFLKEYFSRLKERKIQLVGLFFSSDCLSSRSDIKMPSHTLRHPTIKNIKK